MASAIALSISGPPPMTTARRLPVPPDLNPISAPSARLSCSLLPKGGIFRPFQALTPCRPRMRVELLVGVEREPRSFAVRGGGGGNGEAAEGEAVADEVDEARGKSTLPERFRYLTKEAPDTPLRWPWLIALFFAAYAWRTVLWELTNWKKTGLAIIKFLGYMCKLLLAFVFHYIGDVVTGIIGCIEYCLYSVRFMYANIVAFAPVPELTRIILFSSSVLAIAEATVPNAVNSQPYVLMLAGIAGFGAVKGFIPEILFWLLLAGFFCYSRFFKKKDFVSSALPSAAVLAAVGEPWVRGLCIGLYLAVAIAQYSNSSKENVHGEVSLGVRKLPVPLFFVALSIGIHLVAKWIRYRHLTWMIA